MATTTTAPASQTDHRWGLTRWADLEGRRQPVANTSTTTYAHVLPDSPGLQKLEFESGFAKPTHNGDWDHNIIGRCFTWKDGTWAKVWESPPFEMLFSAQPVCGDFDADGEPEVAVLPFKEMVILSARTGRIKDRCSFAEGRSYGFFGVYDLDGDGKSEFVVEADFAKHVDVLGYRENKLTVLWQQKIEPDISNPFKILRVHGQPVADIDGDGKLEVTINLYDGAGDKTSTSSVESRWRLSVHDGITGEVKAELVDEYLQSLVDVDGDGAAEALTAHTSGAGVPTAGRIGVWSFKSGKPELLWQRDDAAWQTWTRPFPANVNSTATLANQDVLHGMVHGRCCVVFRERSKLTRATWGSGGFETNATFEDPAGQAVAMDANGALLVRCTSNPGPLPVENSSNRGITPATVVVTRDASDDRPTILVDSSNEREQIVALYPPIRTPDASRGPDGAEGVRDANVAATERWRIAGRGQNTGIIFGPVIADLSGDGRRQHIYATTATEGHARLVAADLNNKEIWHHDFTTVPGSLPVWNIGAVVLWQVGRFTDPRRQDVLVTYRRSMMHSEETVLLSGQDGRELWHRDRQISNRGVGGTPFAIADFDADGLDDAASLFPDILYVLKGTTGQDIIAQPCAWPGVPASTVYWGVPIAGEYEAAGKPSVFFGTASRSMTGLIRADGTLAWSDALDRASSCLPAIGDFSGRGRSEAFAIGFDDGARCYDAATGKIVWHMANPGAAGTAETASADINSDGRDEILLTQGNTLYCIGNGSLLWKIDLPANLGSPVIADIDGVVVLLAGGDGYLYCIR